MIFLKSTIKIKTNIFDHLALLFSVSALLFSQPIILKPVAGVNKLFYSLGFSLVLERFTNSSQ